MKKKILTGIFSLFILNSLIGQSLIASYAEISGFTSFSLSVYLSDSLSKKAATLEVDNDSFDRFLKYSLYVSDKESLTPEQLDLCKTIFTTERNSPQILRCPYARKKIISGEAPKRISLDDKKLFANMNGSNTIGIYPDIAYYALDEANIGGQPSEVFEYWLDDKGNERIIVQSGMRDQNYQIHFDNMPDYEELDKVIEFCDKGGNLIENDDGSYIYSGVINVNKLRRISPLRYILATYGNILSQMMVLLLSPTVHFQEEVK